jgi:hypothetical protein
MQQFLNAQLVVNDDDAHDSTGTSVTCRFRQGPRA